MRYHFPALALSGGTIGLIRGERTTLDIVLATTGVVGLLLLSIILARLQCHIRGLIGQLQEVLSCWTSLRAFSALPPWWCSSARGFISAGT